MRNLIIKGGGMKQLLFVSGLFVIFFLSSIQPGLYANTVGMKVAGHISPVVSARKINPTTVEILFSNNRRMTLDFYGENIFRVFQDNSGKVI